MQLDQVTKQIYIVAVNEARLKSHEFVTCEHFLSAALMFDIGKDIIENSGGDVKRIDETLHAFLEEHVPKVDMEDPIETEMFVRLLETAAFMSSSSSRDTVSTGDLLLALFNIPECFAVYIMTKNGVDKLSMMRYISHGLNTRVETAEKAETKSKGFLKRFSVNLTELARSGQADPFVGRRDVLSRTIQVLCRKTKNNPVHVGDSGVGKTAIVCGLAGEIVNGGVPACLENANIYYIDIGGVVAGTKYRGDFEERLLNILKEAEAEKNAIVYLDEIHTVIGAGAVSGGALDATSLIKPFLLKGSLKFIGSTTFEEYRKYFEKDSALVRRFQKIDVDEPSHAESVDILMGVKHKYEEHHGVKYTKAVIKAVCLLSEKYINDRKMPDKAIDVLDETGARVAIDRSGRKPGYKITAGDVEKTVALMAKVPRASVSDNEIKPLLNLDKNIKKELFGQDKAVDAVVNAIQTSRAGLNEEEKPIASLLFVGPTGVGKTEVARLLARDMNIPLIRFDMSEYQEKHAVARLIGSPPGYVGYEEGGLLTDQIRKNPHAVLLLDEIEKAHRDILNILLQVMDYGTLTDNAGKKADFRHVVLLMTSNAGARDMGRRLIGFSGKTASKEAVDEEVKRIFSPEFRNRLDEIILFNHIDRDMSLKIAKKAVDRLAARLAQKGISAGITKKAVAHIAEKGISELYGAREINRFVDENVKKKLTGLLLSGSLKSGGKATVDVKGGEITVGVAK